MRRGEESPSEPLKEELVLGGSEEPASLSEAPTDPVSSLSHIFLLEC